MSHKTPSPQEAAFQKTELNALDDSMAAHKCSRAITKPLILKEDERLGFVGGTEDDFEKLPPGQGLRMKQVCLGKAGSKSKRPRAQE